MTLKGLRTNYIEPYILRNGEICNDCYNFTSLNSGYVTFNVTGFSNYTIQDVDLTNPKFNIFPENKTFEYKIDNIEIDFNVSDNFAINNCLVNDTRLSMNNSGVLKNNTVLDVGKYVLNVTINDTSGNKNSLVYQLNVKDTLGQIGRASCRERV